MSRKTFTDEIRDFRRSKKKWIPILIIVGLLGLVLPIIPGVALLLLAFLLLFPKEGEAFLKRVRKSMKL